MTHGCGTDGFIPPELKTRRAPTRNKPDQYDSAVDIYAFGKNLELVKWAANNAGQRLHEKLESNIPNCTQDNPKDRLSAQDFMLRLALVD